VPRLPVYEHDGLGRAVPQRLRKVFQRRRWMASWCAAVERLKLDARRLSDDHAAEQMNLSQIEAALDIGKALMLDAMPYVPCKCHVDEECELCHNKRWLSGQEFLDVSTHKQL
jgi:hypothetical protein